MYFRSSKQELFGAAHYKHFIFNHDKGIQSLKFCFLLKVYRVKLDQWFPVQGTKNASSGGYIECSPPKKKHVINIFLIELYQASKNLIHLISRCSLYDL